MARVVPFFLVGQGHRGQRLLVQQDFQGVWPSNGRRRFQRELFERLVGNRVSHDLANVRLAVGQHDLAGHLHVDFPLADLEAGGKQGLRRLAPVNERVLRPLATLAVGGLLSHQGGRRFQVADQPDGPLRVGHQLDVVGRPHGNDGRTR